ncbi:hypothetical protein [Candidatus Aalborgicola defluviihabitans]|uniref:hypothetical protein n=1 Tax=Candidatus Aalborgicola defluviihabitans TaxID=3386187 RepID=UPI001D7E2028|nr:hypothetical protein [Burkholderiales bacterium]
MPSQWRSIGQHFNVCTIASPRKRGDLSTLPASLQYDGSRQMTGGASVLIASKVIAQHNGALLQRFGKYAVIVQFRAKVDAHVSAKTGTVLNLFRANSFRRLSPELVVCLGKHNIKPQQGNLLPVKQND